jgi:type IV secretion system protein VirD4
LEKFQELSPNVRLAIGFVAAGLALLAAITIASNVALLLAGRHDGELHLFTIFSLLGGSDVKASKAARIGLIVGLAGVGVLAVALLRKSPAALHGRARWASEREIKAAGLRAKSGLICGKLNDRFLKFGGSEHMMVYAPTRSGKGVGIVVPNLLNWPASCIVADIKKENWSLTAGFRAANGQAVYLFDPLEPEGRTARYNPLGYVRRDNIPDLYDDLQRIAAMLYPSEGKDPFWANAARSGFVGVAGYIAETPGMPMTMGEVLRQIAVPDSQAYFKQVMAERKGELSIQCVTALNDFIGTSENTFQSIRKTISAKLELWLNPRIDAATSANDFDLRELRRQRMSIYLGVTPDNLERLAPLLNLFFQQAVDLNIRTLPEHDKTLKHQVMLMMDEFAALGTVSVIVKGIAYVAGYGLRIVTILQSPSQIRSIYGPDEAKNYMTNHAIEVVYTPKELEDAKNLSERFGYDTVKGKSQSRGLGMSAKSSRNETTSDQRRALMLPQELMMTPMTTAYVIKGGMRPIKAQKIFYYKDAAFTERLMAPPTVKPIKPDAQPRKMRQPGTITKIIERAPMVEELAQPVQPADGSDGCEWTVDPELKLDEIPHDVDAAIAAEAVAIASVGWSSGGQER